MRKLYGPEHITLFLEMKASGLSKREIGERLGWQPHTMNRFINAHLRDYVPAGNSRPYGSGRYHVFDDGRVWSVRLTGFLKGDVDEDGYLVYGSLGQLGLEDKAHRLVLRVFDRDPLPGEIARHLDGSKSNNTPGNLAWGTWSENAKDRVQHGRHHWSKSYVHSH